MATINYSTTLPQAGDPQLTLLGRLAQAIASIATNTGTGPTVYTETAWLASAVRTTTQTLALTVPAGVTGIIIRCYITAVPGVDTVTLNIADNLTGRGIHSSGANAAATNILLLARTCGSIALPAGSTSASGLPEKINIAVTHSGAGSFTYSATYCWLTK